MSKSTACSSTLPFFIVGTPRSGTTLLTYILSSHPRIHIPGETGFLPELTQYANQFLLSREQVHDVIHKVARLNRDWDGLVENENEFYDALPAKTLTCALDSLYRLKTRDFNAERWGDKTPSYVRYIPKINLIFPEAQFIHVIRDGRDTTLSAMQKWGKERWYMDHYYLLKNWMTNVQSGRHAGHQLGRERYLEIHYETLVQNPEKTIRKICDFLREEFVPEMLDHTRLARELIGPEGHVEVRQDVNTQSVERWRREMTTFEKKMANRLVGNLLEELSYPLPDVEPMTLREKSRFQLLGRKYWFVYTLRAALYKRGVLSLNRGKSRKRVGRIS